MKEERYFYVLDAAEVSELPQDEAVHATRVLRLQAGDTIHLMDGKGTFHTAEITLATQKKCIYKITDSIAQERTWHGHIHLAMAPTKMMDRVEWLAEKATEVGFDELSFLNCQFSERRQVRLDRVDKIIIGATKQSRKPVKPILNEMIDFKSFVTTHNEGRRYICHCYEEVPVKDLFSELTSSKDKDSDIIVLVGPEGDFSIDEVRFALEHGYESVTLGKSRLRTETAALMAVAYSNLAQRK